MNVTSKDKRATWDPIAAAIALAVTCVYSWTAPLDAMWMDSGELASAAWYLGAAHPPGHPLYVFLAKAVAMMPLGEIAWRMALLSALCIGFVYLASLRLWRAFFPRLRSGVYLLALLSCVVPGAASNGARLEVYALVAALLLWAVADLSEHFVCTDERDANADRSVLFRAALLSSLALAIHPLISLAVILVPLAAAFAAMHRESRVPGAAPALAALVLPVLLLYSMLAIRFHGQHTPGFFWGSISDLAGLVDLVTASAYQGNVSLLHLPQGMLRSLAMLGVGGGVPVLLLGSLGIGFGVATGYPKATFLLLCIVMSLVPMAVQDFQNPDSAGYLLVPSVLLSLGIGILVQALLQVLAPASSNKIRSRIELAAALPVIAIAMVFGLLSNSATTSHDKADGYLLADKLVDKLPPGPGAIISSGDHSLFPLLYQRMIVGRRVDLLLVNRELSRDRWYRALLERNLPELALPSGSLWRNFYAWMISLSKKGAPLVSDSVLPGVPPPYWQPHGWGLVLRSSPDPSHTISDTERASDIHLDGFRGGEIAGRLRVDRAAFELSLGHLEHAAGVLHLAGVSDTQEARSSRVPILPLLPIHSQMVFSAPWYEQLYRDELAWLAGLPAPELETGPTMERRVHRLIRELAEASWPVPPQELLKQLRFVSVEDQHAAHRHLLRQHGNKVRAWLEGLATQPGPQQFSALLVLAQDAMRGTASFPYLEDLGAVLASENSGALPRDLRATAYGLVGVFSALEGQVQHAQDAWAQALDLGAKKKAIQEWIAIVERKKTRFTDSPTRPPGTDTK